MAVSSPEESCALFRNISMWEILCSIQLGLTDDFWHGAYPGRQTSPGRQSLKKRMLYIDTLWVKAMQTWPTSTPVSYKTRHVITDTWHSSCKHERCCWSQTLSSWKTICLFLTWANSSSGDLPVLEVCLCHFTLPRPEGEISDMMLKAIC